MTMKDVLALLSVTACIAAMLFLAQASQDNERAPLEAEPVFSDCVSSSTLVEVGKRDGKPVFVRCGDLDRMVDDVIATSTRPAPKGD